VDYTRRAARGANKLSRETNVVTPENVKINYELAGIGSRATALVLDTLVQAGLILILFLVLIGFNTLIGLSGIQSRIQLFLADFIGAAFFIVIFLLYSGYFIYYEGFKNGQTPGKYWMRIRVVREEGSPINLSNAIIRNLVRLIEAGLGSYSISIVLMIVTSKCKRLGDYAAGTIVVKERATGVITIKNDVVPERKAPSSLEASLVKDIGILTRDEIDTVRRFVERRLELDLQAQENVARQIALPIMAKTGVNPPSGSFDYGDYLEEVYARCVEELGTL